MIKNREGILGSRDSFAPPHFREECTASALKLEHHTGAVTEVVLSIAGAAHIESGHKVIELCRSDRKSLIDVEVEATADHHGHGVVRPADVETARGSHTTSVGPAQPGPPNKV